MEARLQRRVQRYGWDLAARSYDTLWQAQLAPAQHALLSLAALRAGNAVLDVACGTGHLTRAAAHAVGKSGRVAGVDLSGAMIDAALQRTPPELAPRPSFLRMDGESLAWPDAHFDVVLCALGLMYMPDPVQALREMRRVLRPGGRAVLAVWGQRARCGWSAVFPVVDAEVASEVCPLFFGLGQQQALALACHDAGLAAVAEQRLSVVLDYASAREACDAAFEGGPVAMAWSRFDAPTRARVQDRYLQALAGWRHGAGYRVPAEFVVLAAARCQVS